MQPDDIYNTSDFRDIVYLLCNDARLVRAIRVGDRKVSFQFADKGMCEGMLANIYYNDKVSLTRALHEIRKARDIIHSTP